ncbi:ribonuclease H-like domain-containing protein [Tanacetum coccineum]
MNYEYIALIKNNAWTLVLQPTEANIVRCMWLFRHKYLADETHSFYKARLVTNDSRQLSGVDVNETFNLVVKPCTIGPVLVFAISRHWHVISIDEPHFSSLKMIFRYGREVKYHGVANVVAETCWLRNLPCKLHTSLSFATLVYCVNVSAIYLSSNPYHHQYADIFTKGLPSALFEEFRTGLSVRCPLAPTAGEC